MNYFELFGIAPSFQVDTVQLRKKYQELAGNGDEKEKSSVIREAYRILQDQDETIRYVLQWKNFLTDEEQYELDPQFKMEVMDINEELMELKMDENQEQLMNVEQKANRLMLKLYDDVAPIIDSYQEGITSEEELLQVKEFYYHKKYLQGILDSIKGIRNIASPL